MAKKGKKKQPHVGMLKRLFYSILPTKKNKVKKQVVSANKKASKNKPTLVKLLDEKTARGVNYHPDGIFDAIAEAIVNSIAKDTRGSSKNSGIDNIKSLLAEAESNFAKKEEEDIHRNRLYIKDRLKNESYNGSLLMDDGDGTALKKEKKEKRKKNSN